MLKLSQIIKATPKEVIAKARNCNPIPILTKCKKTVIDGQFVRKSEFKVICDSKNKHHVVIKLYGKRKAIDCKAWVTCSCPWFTFNCEVALAEHGSSDILFSDGSFPEKTNPTLRPQACKHIIACTKNLDKLPYKEVKKTSDPFLIETLGIL